MAEGCVQAEEGKERTPEGFLQRVESLLLVQREEEATGRVIPLTQKRE